MNLTTSTWLTSPAWVVMMKWTGLLVMSWCAHWLLLHRQARWRLIVWRSLLCFGLILPLVQLIEIPGIRIPVETNTVLVGDTREPIRSTPQLKPIPSAPSTATPINTLAAGQPVLKMQDFNQPLTIHHTVNWANILVSIWALGFALGGLRLMQIQWELSRLRNAALPASPGVQDLVAQIKERLGVRRKVEVRISDAISSPFVCGVVQPVIMLPGSLAQSLAPDELSALLNHEMAHIRRNDLAWCVAWQCMRVVCWFHPLVWRTLAAHNMACEQEADRMASGQMPERDSYARLLSRLALRVLALPAVETQLTVNGTSQIARRVKWLGTARTTVWNWRYSAAALTIAGLIFFGTAGCQFAKNGSGGGASPAKMEFKKVLVVVQDDDGKPIEGATITPQGFRVKGIHGADAYPWRKDLFGPPEKVVTDAEGKAYVRYPVEGIPDEKEYTGKIGFMVTHPDYSTARPQDYSVDSPEEPIRLTKGIHLKVSGYAGSDHQSVPELVPMLNEDVIHTNDWQKDDQGAYVFNKMSPGEHLLQLMGRLPSGQIVYGEVIEFAAKKGAEYKFNLEMKPGIRLEGRLDNNVPRPVTNGRVLIAVRPKEFPAWTNWDAVDSVFKEFPNCRFWKSYRTIAPDGTFVFESVPPGGLDVIVHGDGFASKNGGLFAHGFGVPQAFSLKPPVTKIEIATEPTATLEFTAKTSSGKPVEGTTIYLNPNVIRMNGIFGNMRQSSEAPLLNLPPLPDIPYSATTDKDGIAVIQNIPACTGGMDVSHAKYQVPIQQPTGWRDRYVRVSFTVGMTNKLVMTMEPKGTDYLGTAR